MKKVLIAIVVISTLFFGAVFGYSLTSQDNDYLDAFEETLFDIIDDRSNNVTPEKVLEYIEYLRNIRQLSEKQSVLLDYISDDVSYYYYLGIYADDIPHEMLPEDCYDDEYYDEIDKLCYFKDTDYVESDDSYLDDEHAHTSEKSLSDSKLASYEIRGDSIELVAGNEDIKHREVWDIFVGIIPLSLRGSFYKYDVVDDGNSDTGAYVEQDLEDNTKWNMTVNLDAFYVDGQIDKSYVYQTLIHEFAHVLTLDSTQVRYYPQTKNENLLVRFEENCTTQLLGEGCLFTNAYLHTFINTFWSDSEYLEKVRKQEINAYSGNEDAFVTEYAATNPGEDIAESFTYFVLTPKPDGSSISDKKIQFFYDYKKLELLRKQIRSRLFELK